MPALSCVLRAVVLMPPIYTSNTLSFSGFDRIVTIFIHVPNIFSIIDFFHYSVELYIIQYMYNF